MKNYDKEVFIDKLSKIDWSTIFNETEVKTVWSNFKCLVSKVIDEIAPEKIIRVKVRTEPWMTGEIIEMIHQRDHMYYKHKKDKENEALYRTYCSMRNKVQRGITLAKSNYIKNKIEEDKNN